MSSDTERLSTHPRFTVTPHGTLLTTLNLNSPSFFNIHQPPETVYDHDHETTIFRTTHKFLTNTPLTPPATCCGGLCKEDTVLGWIQGTVKYGAIVGFVIGTWVLIHETVFPCDAEEGNTVDGGSTWSINPLGLVPVSVAIVLVTAATVHILRACVGWWNSRHSINGISRPPRDWFRELPVRDEEEGIVLVSPTGWEGLDEDNVERGEEWLNTRMMSMGPINALEGPGVVGKVGLGRESGVDRRPRRGSGGRLVMEPIEESEEEYLEVVEGSPYAPRNSMEEEKEVLLNL